MTDFLQLGLLYTGIYIYYCIYTVLAVSAVKAVQQFSLIDESSYRKCSVVQYYIRVASIEEG